MSLSGVIDIDTLLVEPSATQAKAIAALCRAAGLLRVQVVASAAEALAALSIRSPQLVISALYLPDQSGTDLLMTMRQDPRWQKIAFILVSSETRPQALEPVRQMGVCAILPKPFSRDQLRRALTATLDFLDESTELSDDFDVEQLRVLLVDDSPSARKFMRRVLENLGVRHFVEAEHGRAAIEVMAETLVDLVVTDYNMPEMDGAALIDHIRQRSWQKTVPILMVTSEQNAARLAAVEEAGVSGICDKPFEPAVVKTLLRGILRPSG